MLTVGFVESTALDVIGEADIIYTITAPSLEEIHLSGSINATVTELETRSLFLGLTTFAELHIENLLVTDLEAELNFSSTAHLSGIADTQRLTLDNASTYNAADLSSRTADVDLSELSEATVRVTESVMGSVKTASSLGYICEDVNAEVDSSGLAKIELLPFTPPLFNTATPVVSAPMEAAVEVRAFTFDPYVVAIAAGGTVTWTNFDMIPHNIADSPDGATFRSPQLARGQEYSVTFDEPGTYDYYCPLHPIMAGQVVVVES